jgi:hypothetical protein
MPVTLAMSPASTTHPGSPLAHGTLKGTSVMLQKTSTVVVLSCMEHVPSPLTGRQQLHQGAEVKSEISTQLSLAQKWHSRRVSRAPPDTPRMMQPTVTSCETEGQSAGRGGGT